MSKSLNDVISLLLDNDNFAIGIHANADGDCFGSACGLCSALKKLGKNACILSPMPLPKRLLFLNYNNDDIFVGTSGYESIKDKYTTLITVDVASDHLLDSLSEVYKQNNLLAIDHHSENTITAKNVYVQSEASAAGEVIYKIICMLEKNCGKTLFDSSIASSVFGAISSDTGCFKYSNVSPLTHIIASELIKLGAFSADINYRLFDLKSQTQIAAERLAYQKLELFFDGRLSFIYLSDEELNEICAAPSDTETVSQLGRGIEGVQIAAFMRKKEEGVYKFSVRSNNEADMSKLCASFGVGGGHKKAAGCSIFTHCADTAKEMFLDKAKDYLE